MNDHKLKLEGRRPWNTSSQRDYKGYQHDSEGQLQFIGEDQIDHTPIGKKIKVTVGNAFDVIGKRIMTDFEQVNNNVSRISYEIVLNNNKSGAQNVTVVEHFYGDWKIIKGFDKYEKIDAFTVEFRVSVPANGTKIIYYTVEKNVGAPVETIGNTATGNSTIGNTTTENSIIGSTTAENLISGNTATTGNTTIGKMTKQ